ncbi:SGNH/GDSL hydrolase family protein [Maribacter vaceletii]|uniref:SGNH/GDSL hydrolase family protein n=1 Tax=Maribacter vaceletii TaxID=1206816 RepID=UPI001FE734EC|nr:SGNH/GDSL hydrolase family protein [Maribacter vaceletii]
MLFFSLSVFLSFGCSNTEEVISRIAKEEKNEEKADTLKSKTISILSLGDSYTIGESVCVSCKFPEQLKEGLLNSFGSNTSIDLKVIARTGWTTTNLINAVASENVANNYNLVTLLIGVNNQYQNKPFSLYELEFPALVAAAIKKAKSSSGKVIVVSIPDYAYTPFGEGDIKISNGIDKYNAFAENYCTKKNISFINITDITREGLKNKDLVASDGLHPSELAYSKFVERILPVAISKLEN